MLETLIKSEQTIKTFVFEQEDTQKSIIAQYQVNLRHESLNLTLIFSKHCPLIYHKISIYDPNNNKFINLSKIGAAQNGIIPIQFFEPNVILIRYQVIDPKINNTSFDQSISEESHSSKKGRNKERTIVQVIELVKRWRNYHLHGHGPLKRRVNLQEAAKLVRVSKKSLDDYYCQLRLGEFYNFDFANNSHQKMGYLRHYVKTYQPQKEKNRRQNHKYPTSLKVIEQYDFPRRSQESQRAMIPENNYVQNENNHQVQSDHFAQIGKLGEGEYGQNSNNLFMQDNFEDFDKELSPFNFLNIEHQFFRGFAQSDQIDDPYDPVGDFRKKAYYQQDNNDFIYF